MHNIGGYSRKYSSSAKWFPPDELRLLDTEPGVWGIRPPTSVKDRRTETRA